jgi:hypothetical protein
MSDLMAFRPANRDLQTGCSKEMWAEFAHSGHWQLISAITIRPTCGHRWRYMVAIYTQKKDTPIMGCIAGSAARASRWLRAARELDYSQKVHAV